MISSIVRPALFRSTAAVVRNRTVVLATRPVATTNLFASSQQRGFTQTALRWGSGQSDTELSSKLSQEISYEKESFPSSTEPEFLSSFQSNSPFQIQDKPGSDEVALVREFGNESIRVLFSIGDIDTSVEPSPLEEEDEHDQEEQDSVTSFPVRVAITVSKKGNGAMTIDAQAQDGEFVIENISFYKDETLANDLTADADWARRGLYIGPQFETLDENVQAQFESFLTERGIDSNLALFIPNYAEWKEQKEYCNWLENVKTFVDA